MGENKNIRLILQYEGTNYHGWQYQKNGLSIQEIYRGKAGIDNQKQD
jgi:tRNA pseudouridine38-40 synthase